MYKGVVMGLLSKLFGGKKKQTLGDFERKHKIPAGMFRNPDGRDTRSDKLMKNVRKGKNYWK